MWRSLRITGPVTEWSKTSCLAMNRIQAPRPLPVEGQARECEIEIAGVVDRQHRAASGRQVLVPVMVKRRPWTRQRR